MVGGATMEVNFDITPAEWRLMRVIWTRGETTSTALTKTMTEQVNWKPATVKTLLRRLVKKGILGTTRRGRAFIYRPLVGEEETMDKAADDMFDDFCQHRLGHVLKHVVKTKPLSKADIAELQHVLAKKAETAPDTVPCNCLTDECGCRHQTDAEKTAASVE